MTITLDEKLDDSYGANDIKALQQLEREMYLNGDSRCTIINRVLDLLYENEIINDVYETPQSSMPCFDRYKVVNTYTKEPVLPRTWESKDVAQKYATKMSKGIAQFVVIKC